jgi:hypothetical protein
MPPRQRDVARRPRALRADGLLGHLDDHLLPLLEQLLDAGAAGRARRVPLLLFLFAVVVPVRLGRQQPLEIVWRTPDVGDVQVRALLEADVDECGLHPGEHPFDTAFIDVAGDPSFALAFDVELAEEPIFNEGYAGLRAVGVDHQEAMRHGHALGGDGKITGSDVPPDVNVRVHRGKVVRLEVLVTRNRAQFNDIGIKGFGRHTPCSLLEPGTSRGALSQKQASRDIPLLPSHRRRSV